MNYDNSEKKPFDPTVCFTFFGSWFATIEQMETNQDLVSPAYMLFKAIANYALYGLEPGEEYDCPELKHITYFWPLLAKEIENNISRRKRGFAAEKPNELHEKIINAIIADPKASDREIGKRLGCGKTTVNDVRRMYSERIKAALEGNTPACTPISSVVGSSGTYIGNDSSGRGQSGQAGQDQWKEIGLDDEDDDLPF